MTQHTVLIVDDDPTTRYVLSRVLEGDGFRTTTAENGAQGVRRLVEAEPCVILLDINMPVMDGHDFRDVQKRIAPSVPIICITGDPDAERAARRVGAARLHPKPLDVPALCADIRAICGAPHDHRERPAPAEVLVRQR
jgi:two-component system response regulator MprA